MAKSMERILAEIAGNEIFVDKISCLLEGIKSQLESHDAGLVFERFERNRNKIQIALQNVGPAPEPEIEPNIEPAAEEPPEPVAKSTPAAKARPSGSSR